jgi:Transposase DNA-binding/Transposase Tn5 dimerisation domain
VEPITFSHTVWASQVATAAELPDRRLETRLTTILVNTLESPSASIPEAAGDWGQTQATYRFFANPRVTAAALRWGFALDTSRRCLDHNVVLVVQDSTSLNFTGLNTIPELGPIDSGGPARGVHLHTALALTVCGEVLGIVHQQYWARPQPQPDQPEPQEKESAKWIYGLDGAREAIFTAAGDNPTPRLIHLMDREGDAYEVMMAVVDAGDSAIIRCAQNRRVEDPLKTAHQAVRNQPVLCRTTVPVNRKAGVPERRAWVEVRSLRVNLVPDLSKYPYAVAMTWNLVEVWEPTPPPGAESVHWLLWTREPAATVEEALEVVRKYTHRWPIEDYHLVIKSGCQVEELRLETWESLEKAVTLNTAVAARIVSLRDRARETPAAPATEVLSPDEIEVLVCRFGKGMKPSELTVGQAVRWIGRLGGHLNRKGDGMPGVRTLWRGLHNLTWLVAGFRAGKRLRE